MAALQGSDRPAGDESQALLRELEICEMDGWEESLRAASPRAIEECGLAYRRLGGGVLAIASRVDVLALNRVVGLGVREPARPETIDEILEIYREAGVPRFFVQVSPVADSEEPSAWLEGRGFEMYNRWVKLHRRADEPVPEDPPGIRVERIGKEQADLFGGIVRAGFDWPIATERWLSDIVGSPGWVHYIAHDRDGPVATAGLWLGGRTAGLSMAATLPDRRNRGAQGALILRRIRDAAEHGSRHLAVETAEPRAGHEPASFRNVKRFGFRIAYARPNWIFRWTEEAR